MARTDLRRLATVVCGDDDGTNVVLLYIGVRAPAPNRKSHYLLCAVQRVFMRPLCSERAASKAPEPRRRQRGAA